MLKNFAYPKKNRKILSTKMSCTLKKLFFVPVILLILGFLIGARTAKDEDSRLWQTLEAKGDTAFQHYELKNARQYWHASLKENPDNLKCYNKLGISFLVLKEYDNAVDILKKGLKRDGNNPALNYNLALAYYYSGNVGMAMEVSEKVLTLNRYYPQANYLRGLCFEKKGLIEEARAAYVEELNNNPGSKKAWQKVVKEEL
ncbi:MAG: tetratricopeptide repeat protein [Candidatus Omnitrophica bacterium]|nr:tetratricopeptide repeat protein [Candidatus Omnitrophota bacterium]